MAGPMFTPEQLALTLLQRNPDKAQTPMGQQLLRILQSGDSQAGAQMAQNICSSRGLTPQQALQQAINGMGLK